MTDSEPDGGPGGIDRERTLEPGETSETPGRTRRGLLAALGAAGSAASTGCLGVLGIGGPSTERETPSPTLTDYPTPSPSPSPDPILTETPTPSPTVTPEPTPTPTQSPTPSTEVVWADDFEDGSLSEYHVTRVEGDDDTAGYEIVSDPSIGTRALRHRTESRVLHPAEPVAVSPPAVAAFDLYVQGWSGADFLLQRNLEADLAYRVDVRNNANGGFVRVAKTSGGHADVESFAEDTVGKDGDPDVIAPGRWERIGVRWTDESVEAAALDSDRWVSITDADERLRGQGFGLIGYHYNGWAAVDNLTVRTGTTEISERDPEGATPTSRPDG